MAGIYIHIPFCKQACHYCNFHFSTSMKSKNDFIEALLREVDLRENYLGNQLIETIYFGGGTPSVLSKEDLSMIIEKIKACYEISTEVEFTLEANPDDLDADKISDFVSIGINRLSLGIQSFFDEDLVYMNRAHNAADAKQCIQMAQQGGITNLSVDLIFGYPLLTLEKLDKNLDFILAMDVQHISCYAMTVEPKTALSYKISKGKELPIVSEESALHYQHISKRLKENDYIHYEISNYGKEGFRAKHNSNYWAGVPYIGFGPSAHSFNGESRQWNIANNQLYIQALQENRLPFDKEILGRKERIHEKIMISLRTIEGLSDEYMMSQLTDLEYQIFSQRCLEFVAEDMLITQDGYWKLSAQGELFADYIACELFV